MIFGFGHLAGEDRELSCDVCVVGSGAGGAPVAAEAAARGLKVIVLEAGSYWTPADFNQVEYDMFPRLYHEKAGRATRDKAIHVHQGKGVGGSTLHNLNLCARVPPPLYAEWQATYGLSSLPRTKLDGLYAEVEQRLSVAKMGPVHLAGGSSVLKRGCDALGYRGDYLHHNRVGCAASGFCELGCPFDGKQNALKIYIADAVRAGATVLADTWAAMVRLEGRKAVGVDAVVRHPDSGAAAGRIRVTAKHVCVSASATGTPALLQRSRVPDPARLVGSRLFLHPGAGIAARFRTPLNAWRGIPQSYECTQFLDFTRGEADDARAWLIPSFAHPAGVSAVLSGFGRAHGELMKDYPRLCALAVMVHDLSPGRVNVRGDFGVDLDYVLAEKDARPMHLGLRECARIAFAAGAERVFVPLARTVEIERIEDVDRVFDGIRIEPHDTDVTAVHPMGSVWMGDSPTNSCVDSTGKYHHLDNLYVADTSLYCSSTGVPPQITAYALGTMVGRRIAA